MLIVPLFVGGGGRIRTDAYVVLETTALPLGYSPIMLSAKYWFIKTQPIQFNDCLVGIFSIIGGRFKNYCDEIDRTTMPVDKKITISNTTEVSMTFSVPVSYLYWMRIIKFFHRLNLQEISVLPQDRHL